MNATTTTTPKTPKFVALDTDAVKAIAANARPAVNPCLCGCGETTKGRFFPGHDALLKERLQATITGGSAAAARHARDAMDTFGWAVRETA